MGFIKDPDRRPRGRAVRRAQRRRGSCCSPSARRSRRCSPARSSSAGQACGVGLCIGASLLFLTGDLRRAPVWMQRARLEWLHRLVQEPRRMWRRYLYEGPKILRIASGQLTSKRTREKPASAGQHRHPDLPARGAAAPPARSLRRPRRARRRGARDRRRGQHAGRLRPDRSSSAAPRRARPRSATCTSRARGSPTPATAASRRARASSSPSSTMTSCRRACGWKHCSRPIGSMAPMSCWARFGPVFEATPPRFFATYRGFFTQTSDAATGAVIEPHRPLRLRRDRRLPPAARLQQRADPQGQLLRRPGTIRARAWG